MPTDFWLNMYWLMLCGMLIYLLGYGSRALLILRKDPRSRRIANVYLVACAAGIAACIVRLATAFIPALQTLDARHDPGVGVRLHVRCRLRADVGGVVADEDALVHQLEPLTLSYPATGRCTSYGAPNAGIVS